MPGTAIIRPLSWALLTLAATAAWGEHFDITLSVAGQGRRVEAHADQTPPATGHLPRPVFHGRTDELLELQFLVTDANPHRTYEGLTVHYYLAAQPASSPSAGLNASAPLTEGRLSLDLKPDGKVGWRQQLRVPQPGCYLLRVESEHSQSDHEHFAAIDLQIE